jgi:type I restriction enzyme S subunit
MNSDKNNKTTHQLRFPEFSGSWEEKPLSSFLFEHKTKIDGKCEVHSVSVSKGVVNQVEYLGRSFAAADTSKYNLAKPNDIIYTKSPTGAFPFGIVKQNKNPYNVIVSPLYAVYTPINKYIGYILDSCFESPAVTNNYLSTLIQKGAKNTIQISNDTFVSKNVCLPTDYAEQKKIALFLSEIDALIAAQGQKVEALKERKRGLMQQLFPQPGETTPRLRFPGFTGEWEEKILGESFTERVEKKREDLPLLSLGEDGLQYQSDTSRKDNSNADKSKYLRVSIGDVAYNTMRMWQGRCVYVDIEGIVSPAYTVCKPNDGIDSKFHYYLFKTHIMKIKFHQHSQGLVNDTLNLKYQAFAKIKYLLPPTLAEQEKIAECLMEIDALITSESAKLETLKVHKRGLMQQMFPSTSK